MCIPRRVTLPLLPPNSCCALMCMPARLPEDGRDKKSKLDIDGLIEVLAKLDVTRSLMGVCRK